MLPPSVAELCLRIEPDATRPRYFTERDVPWVAALLAEYRAFEGERRSLLRERLREPLAVSAPFGKLRALNHLLEELAHDRVRAALPPARARWLVFSAAAALEAPRAEVLQRVAAAESIEPSALEAALFADLASERRVAPLPGDMAARDYVGLANRALVAALLARAVEIRIRVAAEAVAQVTRAARRRGLICGPEPMRSEGLSKTPSDAASLYVSGPLALFSHSQVYSRALASLVPALGAGASFELEAACRFARAPNAPHLRICAEDPIRTVAAEHAVADPLLTDFASDLRELSSGWMLEDSSATFSPEGERAAADVEIFHAAHPERRWPLFILRFWTQRSLEAAIAAAGAGLVCADAAGACDGSELPRASKALFFRKRLDARMVLARLTQQGQP